MNLNRTTDNTGNRYRRDHAVICRTKSARPPPRPIKSLVTSDNRHYKKTLQTETLCRRGRSECADVPQHCIDSLFGIREDMNPKPYSPSVIRLFPSGPPKKIPTLPHHDPRSPRRTNGPEEAKLRDPNHFQTIASIKPDLSSRDAAGAGAIKAGAGWPEGHPEEGERIPVGNPTDPSEDVPIAIPST